MKNIKYIDLFCGLGAFHEAFKRSSNKNINFECVFACDIDPNIQKIYHENYNIEPEGDINNIDFENIPEFDILCAGFPCQPFSIAGKKQGFSDPKRGYLFYKILELIDIKNPNTIILENVKNLEKINEGHTFNIIYKELTNRDYHVSYKVLDSKYYNSPQSRKRIYIICTKDKKYEFKDIKNEYVPVSKVIDKTENKYFDYSEKYKLEKILNKKSLIKYKLINKKTGKGGRQGERVYSINNYGPTICATSGGPGSKTGLYEIDEKIRKLNIKESIQMFGFNENFKFNSLKNKNKIIYYLGSSIVINVLEHLIKDLYNIF